MYTYKSFETLGTFTLLRPIFITILIFTLLLFVVIMMLKSKDIVMIGFTVLTLSAMSIIVSGQLLWYSAIIVDELGLGGDVVSTYLFLAIVGFSALNFFIFSRKIGKVKEEV